MSTKFTIWHDKNTHVFSDVFKEDIVGIEIINPVSTTVSCNFQSNSVLTFSLSKDHLAAIAKAYIEWYNNTCNIE